MDRECEDRSVECRVEGLRVGKDSRKPGNMERAE